MTSLSAKRRFCCDAHRVYWNRGKSTKAKVQPEPVKENEPIVVIQPEVKVQEKTVQSNLMPVREKGEDAIDFAVRKSAWKKKYG